MPTPTLPGRFEVARGSNRINTAGAGLPNVKSRSSGFYTNVVPPGQTLPVPIAGTSFYVTATSAPVTIRPSGGVSNVYAQGTGLDLDLVNAFDLLEVSNPTATSIAFQIFVGFDRFIDNRLVLASSSFPQVARPTYPVANAAAVVDIDDISGQTFDDINGNTWYALARVAIVIGNIDAGVTLLLHNAAATVAGDPSICPIFPTTTIRLDVTGNYRLTTGGGNINAIVSEIYQCIPDTV